MPAPKKPDEAPTPPPSTPPPPPQKTDANPLVFAATLSKQTRVAWQDIRRKEGKKSGQAQLVIPVQFDDIEVLRIISDAVRKGLIVSVEIPRA